MDVTGAHVREVPVGVTEAWNTVMRRFYSHAILAESSYDSARFQDCPTPEELCAAIGVLRHHGLVNLISEWFLECFHHSLVQDVMPKFLEHFNEGTPADPLKAYLKIADAVEELYNTVQACVPTLSQLFSVAESHDGLGGTSSPDAGDITATDFPLSRRLHLSVKSVLLTNATPNFNKKFLDMYYFAFKAFHASKKVAKDDEEEEALHCSGCDSDKERCFCSKILDAFYKVNRFLNELDLLDIVAGDAVTTVLKLHIEQYVQNTCKGNFEVSYLTHLEQWLNDTAMVWLHLVYSEFSNKQIHFTCGQRETTKMEQQLLNYLYEVYATVRMNQLFNIIIEFPESRAALEDLRLCLERTNLKPKLVKTLKSSLETRLLHPGVNTSDILMAYISAVKALRILDPTSVMLQVVCEPVHHYLRSREDTVRCIVSSLIDDSSNELATELMRGTPLTLEESYHSDDEGDDWETWQPDSLDAKPARSHRTQKSADIISMLVNIYGSRDLFINEYRMLLAQRLLFSFCYDIEKEIRYLELLKLRFGESQLHYCEVMLKDVADSKRINAYVNSGEVADYTPGEFPVNAMIVSAQFWPSLKEEKLELPTVVQEALDAYTKAFEVLKGNRTLCWKPHLGLVNLELEIKGRTLSFSVSPPHATIIWHFQDKACWTLEELSSVMLMPASSLRRKVVFWQNQGILREDGTDTFVLVEEQDPVCTMEMLVEEEEEAESVRASFKNQQEDELQVYWSFIVGMLTNLDSLPLERIHTMLGIFAMQSPNTTEFSIHKLRQFMDKKVREQMLVYMNSLYSLPKTTT